MTFLKKLALLAIVVLPACTAPGPVRLPDMTFTDRPRFLLDVAEIQVVDQYQPPFRLPNIEHQVPVSPAKAAERWARDRLIPVGASGVAVVTIKDARVIENSLRVTPGVQGVFTKDQAARYDAFIEMSVEIKPMNIMAPEGAASGRAERSRSVAEGITPNENDRVLYELVEGLMRDVDLQLDVNIQRFLAAFIRGTR